MSLSYKRMALRLLPPALVVALLFIATSVQVPVVAQDMLADIPSVVLDTEDASVNAMEVEIRNPSRLVIPSIGLEASVQHVGRNAHGNMAVPTNFTDVGWYKEGFVPGQQGNAVIDGHVQNAFGLPAVFKNLHTLEIGESIYIEDADGTTLTFKVIDIQTYEYDKAPLQTIFGRSDKRMLNLITCSGTWISALRTNSHRLVIYSERLSP